MDEKKFIKVLSSMVLTEKEKAQRKFMPNTDYVGNYVNKSQGEDHMYYPYELQALRDHFSNENVRISSIPAEGRMETSFKESSMDITSKVSAKLDYLVGEGLPIPTLALQYALIPTTWDEIEMTEKLEDIREEYFKNCPI